MRKRIASVYGMKSYKNWSDYKGNKVKCEALTKKRLDLGFTSKKINEKPTARPIQRIIRPATNLTRALTGVRFPNAFALRKRG